MAKLIIGLAGEMAAEAFNLIRIHSDQFHHVALIARSAGCHAGAASLVMPVPQARTMLSWTVTST